MSTVNVEIFAQYIFSRISRSALDARKYDVSEKMKRYRSNRINYKMRENLSRRKCHRGLDARKFSCAKISTFTVCSLYSNKNMYDTKVSRFLPQYLIPHIYEGKYM